MRATEVEPVAPYFAFRSSEGLRKLTVSLDSSPHAAAVAADDLRARVLRFFWTVLLVSAGLSIAGNAVHAVLTSGPGLSLAIISAVVATVPPIVLLAATHGAALLAKVGGTSTAQWIAFVMTVFLAALAFMLSFDKLEGLAALAGVRPGHAWMLPLMIDGSITQATVAVFALSRTPRHPPSVPIEFDTDTQDAAAGTDTSPDIGTGVTQVASVQTGAVEATAGLPHITPAPALSGPQRTHTRRRRASHDDSIGRTSAIADDRTSTPNMRLSLR